ncbi:DNA-3-methyladenine glycosylase I, partial [Streptococcus suis]
ESYQAGLSWEIVLNKRQAFRSAFFNYDIQKVAAMTDSELDSLMTNPDIIRHKAKLYATRANAQAFLRVQEEFGTFDTYLWEWVN